MSILDIYTFKLFLNKINLYESNIYDIILSRVFEIHPHKISYLIRKYKTVNNLFIIYLKLREIINNKNLKFYNSVPLGIFLEGFTNIIIPKQKHKIFIKDIDIKIEKYYCSCLINDYDELGLYYQGPVVDYIYVDFITIVIYTNYNFIKYKVIYNPRLKYFYYNHINNCSFYILDNILNINKHLDLYFNNWITSKDMFSLNNKKQRLINSICSCTNKFLQTDTM